MAPGAQTARAKQKTSKLDVSVSIIQLQPPATDSVLRLHAPNMICGATFAEMRCAQDY